MNKRTIILFISILAILLIICRVIVFYKSESREVKATSDTKAISLKTDWDKGTLQNIDTTTSVGSIKIDDQISTKLSFDSVACSYQNENAYLLSDGSTSSGSWDHGDAGAQCLIDLGEEKSVISARVNGSTSNFGPTSWVIYTGNDPDNLTGLYHAFVAELPLNQTWTNFSDIGSPFSARYLKLIPIYDFPADHMLTNEFEAYTGTLATHTTAPTQIDGGENFWKWDSNTIAQTVPANTSATYRYRTSANGSTWTDWVGSIASVTNRAGDDSNNPTRYRYLQIEATLTNTDGTSTPTIGSYDIGYHVEQKPTAPSAQTAVVQ